jgi:NifU-like protein involved in Fe-S cluster formation
VVAVKATRSDAIQKAAGELTKATYPFMKEVPWNSEEYLLTPGKPDPIAWAKAIAKIIDMGASMDGELVQAGTDAHHAAIKKMPANGVCSEAELTEIYAALGCMIASVPEEKTMAVHAAVKALVDPKVPDYLMSSVTESNAKAAYDALLKFTDVVKANPIAPTAQTTSLTDHASSAITGAAAVLGKDTYPLVQGVDWTSDLYTKPIPGKSPQQVMKAVDKMIVMGSEMDWAALQEAAQAHVKAIEGMDDKGVLRQSDYNAVLAGLGKSIASVPKDTVMDVYYEMSKIAGIGSGVPKYNFSMQNAYDAIAAYNALIKFKDTVAAYQPSEIDVAAVKLAKASYPFIQAVPWNSEEFLLVPGRADPIAWANAIAKIIDMGASMDSETVKAACNAHHAAMVNLPADGVCSEVQLADIYAGIGKMIASVPEYKTMGVYYFVSKLIAPEVPGYLMSKVGEENARAAYNALIEFTQVVKANPTTPSNPTTSISAGAATSITAAAGALGEASYPFMQGVDWTSDLYTKPIPGKSAQDVMKAVDTMIVMGMQMDGAALQEAAQAHVKAIAGMDAKGVLRKEDHKAILAGLGKAISSVPESSVMDVYDEIGKLVGPSTDQIPANLFSKVSAGDAMTAYSALMTFKDTVRAYQPDAIGAAAAKLSAASYPFIKQVPWNSEEFLLAPGTANPVAWAKAVGKIIDMGASMDAELVKAGCLAHHAAIVGLPSSGVCTQDQMTEIYASIGRMVASVPEQKTMGVYDAVTSLIDQKVAPYLMSKVGEENARAAYDALIEFTQVVKANPITPCTPSTTVSAGDASSISAAASALGKASYPFMQGVDWTSDLYTKPIPGKSAQDVMKAVDTMIVMGVQMDGAALQEAAQAHVKAIAGMDAKGVLKQGDYEAILAGLGKAISSVPESMVMQVYYEIGKLVGFNTGQVPANLFSKVKAGDAMTAYNAFLQFKDTVLSAMPAPEKKEDGAGFFGLSLLLIFIFTWLPKLG